MTIINYSILTCINCININEPLTGKNDENNININHEQFFLITGE